MNFNVVFKKKISKGFDYTFSFSYEFSSGSLKPSAIREIHKHLFEALESDIKIFSKFQYGIIKGIE